MLLERLKIHRKNIQLSWMFRYCYALPLLDREKSYLGKVTVAKQRTTVGLEKQRKGWFCHHAEPEISHSKSVPRYGLVL